MSTEQNTPRRLSFTNTSFLLGTLLIAAVGMLYGAGPHYVDRKAAGLKCFSTDSYHAQAKKMSKYTTKALRSIARVAHGAAG